MARLDVSGIEKELASFLDGKDLLVRASPELTSNFIETVLGGDGSIAEIFKQHGGEVVDNHLLIKIDSEIGEKLLLTSKDVTDGLQAHVVKDKGSEKMRIYAHVQICFEFKK
jgi:hypothetical protein